MTRDADVLQDIGRTYAAVSFTITTADDEMARKLEPNAPVSSERFKAMKILSDRGIYKMCIRDRSMDVYITKLRKHLKEDDSIEIINIHGKGYKLITPEVE